MKRLSYALVMLCVVGLIYLIQMNHDFNVYAETCEEKLVINVSEQELEIEINGEEPNYKDYIQVIYNCQDDVTDQADVYINKNVDVNVLGTYIIGFTVIYEQDIAFNSIILHVREDITDPVLSGYYEKYLFLLDTELHESDFKENLTAYDDKDLDITDSINIDFTDVKIDEVGEYTVIIEVSDSANNNAYVTIPVIVLDSLPELIMDVSSFTSEVYDPLPDFLLNVHGSELYGEEANIEVDYSAVNPNVVGSYNIFYTASLYNLTETKTVEFDVLDTTAPEITGVNKIKIEEGENFFPFKYLTVHDNYDDDEEIDVKIIGNYSTRVPGEYVLSARATDESGNSSEFIFELIVEKEKSSVVLWTTIILGIVIVGASGALYYIRKRRGY